MKPSYIYLSIVCLFLLSGCSFYALYPDTDASVFAPTNAEDIKIYTGDITEAYFVIGAVAADAVGPSGRAVSYLKKQAARVGADAIINVQLEKMSTLVQRTGISGVAIKLKE